MFRGVELKFEISKKTVKSAVKCPRDFQCLNDPKFKLCPVESYVKGVGCFLKNSYKRNCPYKSSFGYSQVCKCPVRCEIFEKYHA